MSFVDADTTKVDAATVAGLVTRQFPQWARRTVTTAPAAGAGNELFRLGDDLVVRLPRHPGSAAAIDVQRTWLPQLAARLPLAIPELVAVGTPDEVFPHPWSVFRWLPGVVLDIRDEIDRADVARRLGQFVFALQCIETAGAPPSLRPNPIRGDDSDVRDDIRVLSAGRLLDKAIATAVWDSATAAPPWHGPPVWIHGDLFPMNLLADAGKLAAVIDFDLMGVGDPAIDMVPAWTLLTAETRSLFREAAGVDDDTWIRGRGWALKAGLGAVRKYPARHPQAVVGRFSLVQTIADHGRAS